MAEYIKTKVARLIICDICAGCYSDEPCEPSSCDWMEDLYEESTDAVPVVRCKDCKNGKHWKNVFGIDGFRCDLLCVDISPEAFCSYGKRKENENV